jgi:hypothetical protein
MHDPLDSRNETARPSADARVPAQAEPMATDREVPLASRELPSAVHAWLDGEASPESLSGAEREVALWKRINAETGRRSRMVTPAHVPVQILAKLADD